MVDTLCILKDFSILKNIIGWGLILNNSHINLAKYQNNMLCIIVVQVFLLQYALGYFKNPGTK